MSNAASIPDSADLALRLMRTLERAALAVAVALLGAAALVWALRQPLFDLHWVRIEGEVAHVNAPSVRANVLPQLRGNVIGLDLAQTQSAFAALPWVRRALVHRVLPDGLRVQLEAHHAAAYWGAEGEAQLVNAQGEVFVANIGELEREDLPRLNGPTGQSAAVLALWRTLQPVFAPLGLQVSSLEVNARGSWHAQLSSGAELTLGAGDAAELVARAQRFALSVTQASAQFGRGVAHVEAADLRHADGYALRLQGVRPILPQPSNTPSKH